MIYSMEDIIRIADDFANHFTHGNNKLDYSLESLEYLEDYVDDLCYYGFEDDVLDNAAVTIGCYVFETARRCCGGEYKWSDSDEQPVLVAGLPDFSVAIKAWDKVRGRLTNGDEDNLLYYVSGYKKHIEIGKKEKGYSVLIV